jgi:serine/threonine protein kinase
MVPNQSGFKETRYVQSLSERVSSTCGSLNPRNLGFLFPRMVLSLGEKNVMQEFEVVHGDLKLSNMGITADVLLLLFDWEDNVKGTPGYMAPELREDGTPTLLSDLYSAGVVLKNLCKLLDETDRVSKEIGSIISLLTSQEPTKREAALSLATTLSLAITNQRPI